MTSMRLIIVAAAVVLLVLVMIPVAYFCGWWIPNAPSTTDYPVRGFDVSSAQGPIDWKQAGGSGVQFVYLKATSGSDAKDDHYQDNLTGARGAGLACGAYHFYILVKPGQDQAQNFMAAVPANSVTMPPAIDLEFEGNGPERPSMRDFQHELMAFIFAVREAYGMEPVIYTTPDFANAYLRAFPFRNFWIRDTTSNPKSDGTRDWTFWQYTSRGHVPGVNGSVALDVFNGPADKFGHWPAPGGH